MNLYLGPPHGSRQSVRDGPYDQRCECEDCNLYRRWEAVAEAMDEPSEDGEGFV